MINFTQLKPMLELQNTMNNTVDPNWVSLGWDYMRASCLEGSEAIEHHGWKWWKHQKKDLPQLQMEIIDIWHFYLSRYLQLSKGNEVEAFHMIEKDWAEQYGKMVVFDGKSYDLPNMDLLAKLDLLIGLAAAKRMDLYVFFSLSQDCDLTWADLFEQYVKKNLLNIFRQKNGYKEGTYHKEWFGQEDNVYLLEEASKLDPQHENYVSSLWQSLEKVYKDAVSKK
jgi:dimeric dUTPase (all-alpha-NTP-PPase superfamily)